MTTKVTANLIDTVANTQITGVMAVAQGGTGAANAASARANLDVPSRSGANATGTWAINISGSANSISGYTVNQNLGTANDVQFKSLGIGTAASGTAGELRTTNDITAWYSSDERLKTNIELIPEALKKVNGVSGVFFDWNDTALTMYPDRIERDVGVIAQQMQNVLPEVVATRDNGFLAVRYEKIVPLLIEAIKELDKKVKDLTEKLENNGTKG